MAEITKRDLTRRILLTLLGAGGTVIDSFLDPYGRLRIANIFIDDGQIQRYKMIKKLRALEQQQLVGLKEKKGEIELTLTERGSERALRYKAEEMQIAKPDYWDRKWRLVLFDIPEEKKVARNNFKKKLDEFGFVQLQHSVYIHPYECHNEINFIRSVYGVHDYVKMLVVDKVEGEAALRQQFNL